VIFERREAALALAVVLASLAVTRLLLGLAHAPVVAPLVRARQPLHFGDDAERCASCHPAQSAEWRRSVMAHAVSSPLFQALELLIEEQVGRSASCPEGAGVLRRRQAGRDCLERESGRSVTGAGGEGWCVSCHAPGQNLGSSVPAWNALERGPDNRPLGELLGDAGRDGIGCTFCHQVGGPVQAGAAARGAYEGNPTWFSPATGAVFPTRVSPLERRYGISNSGYRLDPAVLLARDASAVELVPGGAHARSTAEAQRYLASSEFCGSCHDVRLFGTDVLGRERGEHFKRLRNGYSEWREYARAREARGLAAPSCQGCHLSSYPGVCVPDADEGLRVGLESACPRGFRFEPREPGELPRGYAAAAEGAERDVHPHYFTGVEVPLAPSFLDSLASETALDRFGLPLGARARQRLLLQSSVRLTLGRVSRRGGGIEIPVTVENVGAGHRVPGGFSQERELWVELTVSDARGRALYEVGRVSAPDEDLADKRFVRVNVDGAELDAEGRPLGLLGADVSDGPDAPRWDPAPEEGGLLFRGRGLVSFQNGFLRCVRCIGALTSDGRCEALPGQETLRSGRYADGEYDPDTGACGSNLRGRAALFETYFPVGALDASRGILKAPDAIIDTRSLAPATPVTYVYALPIRERELHVTARLLFRAFPPYLIRAFAAYEAARVALGARQGGPLVNLAALERLDIVELGRAETHGG
jgi:hypothetical protein